VFSFFPLDSKNRHFARLQRETAISENAAIPHFLRKKNLKTEVDGWLAVADSLNQLLSP